MRLGWRTWHLTKDGMGSSPTQRCVQREMYRKRCHLRHESFGAKIPNPEFVGLPGVEAEIVCGCQI